VQKQKNYEQKRGKINNRITQRENQIKRLKNKLTRLDPINWIDEILQPIAELLVKKMPDRYYEILGPFGLTSHTALHFYKKEVTNKNRFEKGNCLSIDFRPVNLDIGEIVLVDNTTDTGKYKNGTMGEVNGMNHPNVPMKKTIDELLDWINRQNA